MEQENLQCEDIPKGSPQGNEDQEKHSLKTHEWNRQDNEQQDVNSLEGYARRGKSLFEEITRVVTIITEKRLRCSTRWNYCKKRKMN